MRKLTGRNDGLSTGPKPEMECWLPDERAESCPGLVIFPGGGYQHLAEHEGRGYAEFFSGHGIACFVVRYRLGNEGHKHPAMIEDAVSAVRTVRSQATELGVNPDRIGVVGSSAGGHLAAHLLTAHGRFTGEISARPDFGVLCYPVISMMDEFGHRGSRTNLLGEDPDKALIEEVSCELQVGKDTPPCFIWHTVEDATVPVENSMMFADALRRNGVEFELHIYTTGRHGMGLDTEHGWGDACLAWVKGKVCSL